MVINVASFGGRSHLLNLAIELEKYGHKVRFYSYVPTRRAVKFGLKRESSFSYFILSIPFLFLIKISNNSNWSKHIFWYCFDHITAWISPPCDVFIGQSPMHVYSLIYAKKKHGSIVILERGTRHVLTYINALSSNPKFNGRNIFPKYIINRDLLGYEKADYISIASDSVRQSFIMNSFQTNKLFVNSYGVNLDQFKGTKLNNEIFYDIIIIGQWSYRKGCDLLRDVCIKNSFTLLHVGSIIDVDFPNIPNFKHFDPVAEIELVKFYEMAKIFVIPSREEGMAMVQLQAIACGLPIVCSKYSGGRDLRLFISDPKWIIEMEELTVNSLENSIKSALILSDEQKDIRKYSRDIELSLSWEAYGKRYNKFLNEKCFK